MSETVEIALPAAVEITEANKHMFYVYAGELGVQVGTRGRLPKAKLVKAIQESDTFTLVDTPFLNAAMLNGDTAPKSEYGAEKAAARAVRDAAVKAANDAYDAAVKQLKVKHGHSVASSGLVKPAGDVVVSARVPQRTRDGNVKLSASGKVQFRPNAREATVTNDEIRATVPDIGERGRPSGSQAVYTAAVAGDWVPKELMTAGWESKYLRDITVVSANADTSEPADIETVSAE